MHILLAYAPADGQEPAGRLAELLETVGLTMVEAELAPQGTGVIALLTPAALADRAVLAALQAASSQGRPLLPLSLTAPAAFPTAADLARILEWRAAAPVAPAQASKYHVVNAVNSTIGDHAVTVNVFGPVAGWSAAETAQLIAALRSQQSAGVPMSAAELRRLFAGLQAQMQGFDLALRQGLALILARFDLAEQRILAPVLARLDAQETALVAALLDALEGRVFPAEELGQHLAVIQMALAQINVRSAQMRDQQLAAAVQHAAEIVSAPSLDVKHKLKVTLPIVPALIAYEEEFELGSGMNLPEVWRRLRARVSGQR
jgi:hypothetical protein